MNRDDLELLADDDTDLASTVRDEVKDTNDTRLHLLSDNIAEALLARAAYVKSRLDV